jgi:myo-inositol-1(or 4)-monophosphatase
MEFSEINDLRQLIRNLAQQHIMSRFEKVSYSFKKDGSLVTEADTVMQESVTNELAKRWPDYKLLGEEMTSDEQEALLRDPDTTLWILDPLDGTTNFASGVPVFSVSLSLIKNGRVEMGLVYDPVRDECFMAINEQGAWINDTPLKLAVHKTELKQCIAQIDFKRLPKPMSLRLAKEHPYASQRNFGSGALDWCWLAAGRSQLYLHGGQKLWDYIAGQLILKEAGGKAMTFDKEDVFLPVLTPRSVIAAANQSLLEAWSNWILEE